MLQAFVVGLLLIALAGVLALLSLHGSPVLSYYGSDMLLLRAADAARAAVQSRRSVTM